MRNDYDILDEVLLYLESSFSPIPSIMDTTNTILFGLVRYNQNHTVLHIINSNQNSAPLNENNKRHNQFSIATIGSTRRPAFRAILKNTL